MNVAIICSSKKEIDPYYKSIARSISSYLANSNFDLVFGACSESMMGICYDEFISKGRNVYAVTTEKYIDDLENLKNAIPMVCETTFELKQEIFELADIIVALPGGNGTDSEILSFIEEIRSNDKEKPIEIYDEDGFFKPLINGVIKEKIDSGFNSKSILNYFNVSKNKEEFETHIGEYIYKKEERQK